MMKLTPAGEVVLAYARGVEDGLEQVRTDIRSIKTLQRGTVKLGISESFTREFLPQFLQRFHTLYPGINFEVVVAGGSKLVEQLARDELDISLSYIAPDIFDITVVEQVFIKPCLLVASNHAFAKRPFVDLSECADEEMALPDETLTIRGSYVRMFAKAKIKPRSVMVTNSFELMRASATAGLCVAIVNKYFGGPKSPRGLKYVPLRGKGVEKWPLNICVHTDRNLPAAARIFLEHLQQAVRRFAADD
ncbi:Cyn operon transcriptional activator [Variovorax sp. PBS-H4]|nr:Cyn operon transcriptional activator [Variovorax sp. PBS-H4]